MKKETGIKYVVKVLSITKRGQKIHFTVKHPENALWLNGIAVTTSNIRPRNFDGPFPLDITGALSLAIPDKGDVFYTEEIKLETNVFKDFVEQRIRQEMAGKEFSQSGTRREYFTTWIPVSEALMEGFFAESAIAARPARPAIPIGEIPIESPAEEFYRVTLYLRYVMKQSQEHEN